MHKITYLEPHAERTILTEAAGKAATQVLIAAPTVVEIGETFSLGVSFLDSHGFPCTRGTGTATIEKTPALDKAVDISFPKGQVAACRVSGASLSSEGFHRLSVRYNGKTFYSNPICCVKSARRRIWWGDPHIHTLLSDCMASYSRSPEAACIMDRDVYFLDWVTMADHVSNGRTSTGKWRTLRATEDRFEAPGKFSVLPGYEASLKGNSGGDNNVYFLGNLEEWVDEHGSGDIRTLCEKMPVRRFFVVPHHTSRTGKHGAIPYEIYPGPETMPVMEIHSKWGTSEFRGNPTPLHNVEDGPVFAQDLLAQGYHMGFIGGTDTHASLTMAHGKGVEAGHLDRLPGLTAVHASALDRRHIFTSTANRHCYAAAGDRVYLDVTVAGRPMGQELTYRNEALPKKRTVRISCAGREDIKKIEVIRNGKVVHTEYPHAWNTQTTWTDQEPLEDLLLSAPRLGVRFAYYYVRATFPGNVRAWSSPVRFAVPDN